MTRLHFVLALFLFAVDSQAVAQEPTSDWMARVERLLGAPCRPSVPAGVETTCGTNDRVAVVRLPVDYLFEPPATAERLFDGPTGDARRRGHRVVALVGERLWVHDVTCGACRRVLGEAYVVELPFAPPDALLDLQRRLGLPTTRPLATARDWRVSLRSNAPRR
jgi:hypothetical protein